DELTAHIDVTRTAIHRSACNQAALDQQVRVVPHDLAVFAGAGLGLIGVDHEIMRPIAHGLWHERPFHAGRETRAAAAAKAGCLDLIDDGVAALVEDRLGAIPRAALPRTLEAEIALAVKILEDAVLVVEHL